MSCLCCHLVQRTVESNACSPCPRFPVNCKKLSALSVQIFRQDKVQLFSPVSGAVLIYIRGRSAPLCGASLKGETDCVLLVPYLCLKSSVKNIFLDFIKMNFKFFCHSRVLPCPLPWEWDDARPSCSTAAVREQVGSCWVLLCTEAWLNTHFGVQQDTSSPVWGSDSEPGEPAGTASLDQWVTFLPYLTFNSLLWLVTAWNPI